MNFTSISKIKKRLINIIDSVLIKYDPSQANIYGLDQSKLQDLIDILQTSIIQKSKQINPIKPHPHTPNPTKISLPPPQIQNSTNVIQINGQCSKLIEIVDSTKLIVHSVRQSKSKNLFDKKIYQFPKGTLKKFCTVTRVNDNKVVLAGGCGFENPGEKVLSVCVFQLQSGTITKIGQLLDPLSSHAAIYIEPRLFLIGGKKNEGIITKMCSYFDIQKRESVEIAALNYAVASSCVVNWKNSHIYKIGGVGDCFGQWNISPYIQRYHIAEDIWEVINPFISESSLNRFHQFQLYAHSMAYVNNRDELVVLGGFGADRKGTNFGCIISIRAHDNDDNDENIVDQEQFHEIVEFGPVQGLVEGGFWTSDIIVNKAKQKGSWNMIMLQTTAGKSIETQAITLVAKE